MFAFVKKIGVVLSTNMAKVGRATQRGYASVKALVVTAVTAITATIAAPVLALPVDYTTLTDQIDLTTTSAALLLAAAALIGVAILWKGAKMIMRAFGG